MPGFLIGGIANVQPCPGESGKFDNRYFQSAPTIGYSSPSNVSEYLRDYRFLLRPATGIESFDKAMQISCKGIKPPQISSKTVKIYNGSDYIIRPLRKDYSNVTLTFETILDSDGSSSERVVVLSEFYKWWGRLHNTLTSSGIDSGLTRKGSDIIISMLDGFGRFVWSYKLIRAFPSKISPRDLSYAGDGLYEISVILEYGRFEVL